MGHFQANWIKRFFKKRVNNFILSIFPSLSTWQVRPETVTALSVEEFQNMIQTLVTFSRNGKILVFLLLIGLIGKVLANGLGDQDSILSWVIPKSKKMVLDTSLLNTQHYKVHIKGKVAVEKRAFGSLLTTVANFTYFAFYFIANVFYFIYFFNNLNCIWPES